MFDVFQFEQGFSARGVPVFVKNLPWVSGWLEIRIAIRAGARWDPPGKEGLAHFFEHVPFRGSVYFPTFGKIRAFDDEVFIGTLNASTSFDGIIFSGKCQKSDIRQALTFLQGFIFKPLFRPSDIEKEKGVIVQEIWSEYGQEAILNLVRKFREDIFLDHPFARMNAGSIGWKKTVLGVTPQDIMEFHRTYIHLGNISILFVGDINLEEALELADLFSEEAPRDEATPIVPPVKTSWPKPRCLKRDISEKSHLGISKKTRSTTAISFQRILPRLDNPAVLTILGDILFEITSTIMREEAGAAYHIAENRQDYQDITIFGFDVKVAPGKARKIERDLKKELTGFETGQYKNLFERKKRASIKHAIAADNRASDIVGVAAEELLSLGEIIPFSKVIGQRMAVNYEDISRIVREEMNQDLLYWFILRP